jgi:hypothetical protein
MRRRFRVGLAIFGALCVASTARRSEAQDEAARPEFYTNRVRPIFSAFCLRCHGGMNHRGGYNMETHASMMKGGKYGAAVIPGDPAGSLLIRLMRHQGPANNPMPMPPSPRPRVSDADIATVERWIKAGAIMPADVAKP